MSNQYRVVTGTRSGFALEYLSELKRVLDEINPVVIDNVIGLLEEAYQNGKQVLIAGNGGSASTASHMACDLGKSIVPFCAGEDIRGIRALALTDNVAWMSAIANDIGYEHIFSEQVRTLLLPGDIYFAISASGNSSNIVKGAEMARKMGGKIVSFLGFDGGLMKNLSDVYVLVERDHYGYVEDVHMVLDHLITSYFQQHFKQWQA